MDGINMRTNGGTVLYNKDPGFPDEIWERAANQGKVYILTPRNSYVESERGQGVLTSKNKENHGHSASPGLGCLARPPIPAAPFVSRPRRSLHPQPSIVVEIGATS